MKFRLLCLALFVSTTMAAPEVKYVCEHDTLTLSCSRHRNLHILGAIYGRNMTGEQRCSHSSIIVNSGCKADQSLEIVRGQCDGKESCTVAASNSVFGDPCVGTYKYLEVQYRCIFTKFYEYVCEHSDLELGCDEGRHIDILDASYGRHVSGEERCPHSQIRTTECHAGTSRRKVYSACQGKQNCTVPAENFVFGDPCPGTYKYLDVEYSCRDFKYCHTVRD